MWFNSGKQHIFQSRKYGSLSFLSQACNITDAAELQQQLWNYVASVPLPTSQVMCTFVESIIELIHH